MELGVAVVPALRRSGADGIRLAQAAERLGLHSLWTGENVVNPVSLGRSTYPQTADGSVHWTHDESWPDALASIAFLAGVTETIRFGTSVVAGNTRHPLLLAKQAATVDHLSGGRLILGLGAGWAVEQSEILGQPHDRPNARLEETIDILRKAWGEESFEHRGRFWSFDEVSVVPRPAQGAALPIWIGGRSERSLAIAAERADGVVLSSRRIAEVARVRAALSSERPLSVLARLTGDLDEDVATVRQAAADGASLVILQLPAEDDMIDRLERLVDRLR